MYIKLIEVKEMCGACPTHYIGTTENGESFDAYFRHGYMGLELDNENIMVLNGVRFGTADGACSFDDFKAKAARNDIYIDTSEAKWSSRYEEEAEEIRRLLGK